MGSWGDCDHHRQSGRHSYDRAERFIPPKYFHAQPVEDENEFTRWMVALRSQNMGLLRPTGDPSIWSGCGPASQWAQAFNELVEIGQLVPVQGRDNGTQGWPDYLPANALKVLEAPAAEPRVIFLGPLDSLL